MTTITAFDRPAIFRAAWQIARDAAARTGEAVRAFFGNSLRMAWGRARADRFAAAVRCGERRAAVVEAGMICEPHTRGGWKSGFGASLTPDGRPSCTVVNTEEQAVDLAEEALANYRASRSSEPARSPEQPDLSTAKGHAEVLVGRTAVLPLVTQDAVYTIASVERWTSPDKSGGRDYVKFSITGNSTDGSKGPAGLFIERKGGGRGTYTDTKLGRAWWGYGGFCDSGNKRCNANDLVKELLDPII